MNIPAELREITGTAGVVVEDFVAGGSADLSVEELRDLFVLTGRLGRLVDALRVFATGEAVKRCVEQRGEAFENFLGCRDMVTAVELTTGMSGRSAHALLRAANLVSPQLSLTGADVQPMLPTLQERVAAGDLGLEGLLAVAKPLLVARRFASADEFDMAERAVADAVLTDPSVGEYRLSVCDEEASWWAVPGVDNGADTDNSADAATDAGADAATDDGAGTGMGDASGTGMGDAADDGSGPARDAGPRGGGSPATVMRPAPVDNLQVHAEVWAARISQDGAEPAERDEVAARNRSLTLGRQRDGLVPIQGKLLPEVAGQLALLLAAVMNPKNSPQGVRFAPSWEAAPVRMVPAQGRHDAFMSILTAAARTPELPVLGGAAPTLVVRVDAADLASDDPTGIVEIDGGFTAPLSVARQVSCGGALTRVTMMDGRVTAVMTEERVFNRHQRQAIAARDKTCVMLGCDVPAMWCEIHHVTSWAKNPSTAIDNGVLLCWAHHRFLETSGWQIRMNNGVPEIKPPGWMDTRARWHRANDPEGGASTAWRRTRRGWKSRVETDEPARARHQTTDGPPG